MPHIQLAYNWTPQPGDAAARHQTSPLRNPLMDLLQAVREAGSIAGAAKTLQLSYRHVWGELKRWEQALEQPLILWEKGHAARLSEFADKLLWAERQPGWRRKSAPCMPSWKKPLPWPLTPAAIC
jgi:putative molybdopterin biosynthesis protein